MIEHLTIRSMEKFNVFPAKHGVSDHCIPKTPVTGETFDCEKHCKCKFGECTQADAKTEPGNDMRERSLNGIHLRLVEKNNAGHCTMDLDTRKEMIQGRKITVAPLNDTAKNRVENLAK